MDLPVVLQCELPWSKALLRLLEYLSIETSLAGTIAKFVKKYLVIHLPFSNLVLYAVTSTAHREIFDCRCCFQSFVLLCTIKLGIPSST